MRWLRKAEEDLGVAESCLNSGFYAASCFYSQQASEMALKAFIIFSKGYQPFTHSLTELAEEVLKVKVVELPKMEELRWLQEHYLQSRYPNVRMSDYERDEAVRALELGRRVVDGVVRRIEGGTLQ